MRKKECYTSNFALFWESFDFLNSFIKTRQAKAYLTRLFIHS